MPDVGLLGTVLLPRLMAMLALIAVATLSGVIKAVVRREFEWRRIADFLSSMVLPKVGGWLLIEILAFFTSPDVFPADTGVTHDILKGLGWAAYSAGFGSLLAQFLSNLYEMGVLEQHTKHFARKGGQGVG
jgi:hypothetical protein